MFHLLNKGMMVVMMFTMLTMAQGAEVERRELTYKGNEQAWQCVGGSWETNEAGDLLTTGRGLALNTEQAYGDCVLSGKFGFRNGKVAKFIVRSLDSRRFYAVLFSIQGNNPHPSSVNVASDRQHHVMASIWKGSADGYQRMLAYRRKVGIHLARLGENWNNPADPDKWYEVRVECVGPEILVFFEDNFVCATRDEEYQAGLVGVGSSDHTKIGRSLWKELTVAGQPVELQPPWSVVETLPRKPLPDLPSLAPSLATARYLPSLGEWWKVSYDNFWLALSRSKDGGRTWSEKKRLNLPFPSSQPYQPIPGKAGRVFFGFGNVAELSDGSIGCTGFWRNNPDGNYYADQVQFARSTDGGQTWSISPVDANEWERNESSWVELANGELLCVMRSNYQCYLGVSRSRDKGKTWSRVRPAIPFFNHSEPCLLRTSDNILILGTRNWGLFTSVDNGHTWSLPTDIGSYTGGDMNLLREMPDGRILVQNPRSQDEYQFITVDRQGVIHPALPPPAK